MKEQILKLQALGLSQKEIAEEIGCTKSTVSYHIGNRVGRKDKVKCRNCETMISSYKTYCNNDCQINYLNKDRLEKFNAGLLLGNDSIRKALIELNGDICSLCPTTSNWNSKPLTLQVDHVDGNSDNNEALNLRLVCPNCHSQLETSKATQVKKETKRNSYLRRYKTNAGLAQLEEQ